METRPVILVALVALGSGCLSQPGDSWAALDFDKSVTLAGGALAELNSFAFTTTVEGPERSSIAINATYQGVAQELVRTHNQSINIDISPNATPRPDEINLVTVHQILHTFRDRDTEENGTVVGYVALDWSPYDFSPFVKLKYESSVGSNGSIEYHLTPGMRRERSSDRADYQPYIEGAQEWHGYTHFHLSYDRCNRYAAGFVTDEGKLRPGIVRAHSQGVGLLDFRVDSTMFEVDGYRFTGYNVTMPALEYPPRLQFRLTISPQLPIPYYCRIDNYGSEVTDHYYEYRLTGLSFVGP